MRRNKSRDGFILYNFWASILVALGIREPQEESPKQEESESRKEEEKEEEPILLTARIDVPVGEEEQVLVFEESLPPEDEPEAEEKEEDTDTDTDILYLRFSYTASDDFVLAPRAYDYVRYEPLDTTPFVSTTNFAVTILPSYFAEPISANEIENEEAVENIISGEPDVAYKPPMFGNGDFPSQADEDKVVEDTISAKPKDASEPPMFSNGDFSSQAGEDKVDEKIISSKPKDASEPPMFGNGDFPSQAGEDKTKENIVSGNPADNLQIKPKPEPELPPPPPEPDPNTFFIDNPLEPVPFDPSRYDSKIDTIYLESGSILAVNHSEVDDFYEYSYMGNGVIRFQDIDYLDLEKLREVIQSNDLQLEKMIYDTSEPISLDSSPSPSPVIYYDFGFMNFHDGASQEAYFAVA